MGAYLDSLWSSENPVTQLFFLAFVSRNATVPRVSPPPSAQRAHQSEILGWTWFSLLGVPRLSFFHLIFFFSFTHIWLVSLQEPGNKEITSSHPRRGVSVPLPEACTAHLGTTDLCSFVRVILPFCVNYALPASCLSPPQSDSFRHPPS